MPRPWTEPRRGLLRTGPLPPWPEQIPGPRAEHGTDTRYHYRRDPCRCDDCTAAHRAKCWKGEATT
jgi:hypothetical protein